MSSSATSASGTSGPPKYRTVRELGSRSPRSYAAIREPNELVVMHRYARAADARSTGSSAAYVGGDGAIALGSEAMGLLLRDAKCLEKHWHANIARVRHVDVGADDLVVATELVEGATLADLLAIAAANRRHAGTASTESSPLLPLPVVVRILVDVLAGLHGLHGLRDATNTPLGVIHGALCPSNIVVGKDGVARLVNALRPRPVKVSAASEGVGYAAPEALDVGGTSDLRADLHGVGVILWEAVMGRRLYEENDPARVLARQREEEIDPLRFPPSSPFAPLADVVMCALAFDPALRFKTSAEMGAALRNIAGSRIASGSVVAAQVADLAGDRIRARRVELDPSSSGTRRRASHSTMQAAQTAGRAFAPQPIPAQAAADVPAPPREETPAPPSRRATVPPASLLESLHHDVPPTSEREELSIREIVSSAPPVHESAMLPRASRVSRVSHEAPKPPRPPPPVSRKPPPPTPSMTPAHVSPLSPSLPFPAAPAPPAVSLAPPALSLAPAPALAPERTSTPDKTFAPVVDPNFSAYDSAPAPFSDAPPAPPVRKASPAVLAAAAVFALLGAGLALRAIFSDHTAHAPPSAASTELPPSAVTAPPATAATTEPSGTERDPAKPVDPSPAPSPLPSIEPPAPETTATTRAVAPAAPVSPASPPAAQPRFVPSRPAAPPAPARPKKPYEPSAI